MTSKSKELFPLKKRVGQKAEEREILTREIIVSPCPKETDKQRIRKRGHLTVTSEKNILRQGEISSENVC